MKRLLALAALLALMGCHGQYGSPRQAVLDNEASLSNAFNSADGTDLDKLIADDFVGVNSQGNHYDKAGLQRLILQFRQSGQRLATDHVQLRIYGDAAVAQGFRRIFHTDGTPAPGTVWTDTWIYTGGSWKLVASSDTPMPR